MLVAATVNVEMYDVRLLEMACSLIDSMRWFHLNSHTHWCACMRLRAIALVWVNIWRLSPFTAPCESFLNVLLICLKILNVTSFRKGFQFLELLLTGNFVGFFSLFLFIKLLFFFIFQFRFRWYYILFQRWNTKLLNVSLDLTFNNFDFLGIVHETKNSINERFL